MLCWFPKEADGLQPPAIMAPGLCSAERIEDVADEVRKEKGQIWSCSSSPLRLGRTSQPSWDSAGPHVLQSRYPVQSVPGRALPVWFTSLQGQSDCQGFIDLLWEWWPVGLLLHFVLCSFVFSCVFAGWGKQEIHSSGTNSLRIGQLFFLMMQWDDVIFNGMTKRSNPTLCTGLTFVGTMHCRWWLFRCSADLISPADGYSCSTGWKMPVSFQGTSLLCSAAICAPWHGRLRLFALYSSFYFQTQNCLQLAETKTVISVQKPFWVKKCLLWFMINSEL